MIDFFHCNYNRVIFYHQGKMIEFGFKVSKNLEYSTLLLIITHFVLKPRAMLSTAFYFTCLVGLAVSELSTGIFIYVMNFLEPRFPISFFFRSWSLCYLPYYT